MKYFKLCPFCEGDRKFYANTSENGKNNYVECKKCNGEGFIVKEKYKSKIRRKLNVI